MLLKFGFDIIKKNIISSIAIILQIVISVVMLNFSIATYNNVTARLRVISGFDSSKTIYYMSKNTVTDNEIEKLQNTVHHSAIEPICTCGFTNTEDNVNIFATAYGNKTSERLAYKMVSGKWYDDCPKENGVINVVAFEGSDFKAGDNYEADLFSYEKEKPIHVKIKITGIVNSKIGVISGYMSSNIMQTDVLCEEVDFDSVETNNWFLFNYNDILKQGTVTDELMMMQNMFIFSDAEDPSEYIHALSNSGNACTFQTIIDNSSEKLAEKLHTVYPVAAGVLFSGVLGAECLIILNNLRNRKRFAIYYICGMKWNDCIKISVIQLSYLIAAAFPLTCIAFAVMFNFNIMSFNEITLFDTNNVIVTVGVILLMYFISVVSSKLMVSGSAPKDYLKD